MSDNNQQRDYDDAKALCDCVPSSWRDEESGVYYDNGCCHGTDDIQAENAEEEMYHDADIETTHHHSDD